MSCPRSAAWRLKIRWPIQASGAKTVVISTDDSTPGEVYVYVGEKQATGTTIEKAGLTGGELYGISASFGDDTGATPPAGTFS